ncbi:hypothetical protein, partial [Streptomyces sp. PU-14G]|uniref:hypothetical protein n=1 Tax=Streptomyces sp. PU-14G TaxID=2800808 RepID=UPI0034DF3CB9
PGRVGTAPFATSVSSAGAGACAAAAGGLDGSGEDPGSGIRNSFATVVIGVRGGKRGREGEE